MYNAIAAQTEQGSFDFCCNIDILNPDNSKNIISPMYVLEKQISYWKRRARVKKKEPMYDGFYDLSKNDFSEI